MMGSIVGCHALRGENVQRGGSGQRRLGRSFFDGVRGRYSTCSRGDDGVRLGCVGEDDVVG